MNVNKAHVGAMMLAASIASLGCASIPEGAQAIFARVNTCPPERVIVTARPDVAPHTIVKQKQPEASPPPPEVAADPERMRFWRSEHPVAKVPDVDAIAATYEVSGCGKTVMFACAHPVVGAGGPFWATYESNPGGDIVGFDSQWGVQVSRMMAGGSGVVVCIPEGQAR
jgi:hypothetical protein